MSVRQNLIATAIASIIALAALPASSQTLRYANQGTLKSLDPYSFKESTTIAHHAHVYEGLTARGKDLSIMPGLAESWTVSLPRLVAQCRVVCDHASVRGQNRGAC